MRLGHVSEVELTEYADGELPAQRMPAVEAHLSQCRLCSVLLAGLRQTAVAASRLTQRPCPAEVRSRAAAVLGEDALRISCKQAAAMIHEHLDRRLSLLAQVPFELHLRACKRCQAEMAALTGAAQLVRRLPEVEAPARVREQVLAAGRRITRRPLAAPQWRPALAAAFAALVVGALALVKPLVGPAGHRGVTMVAARPSAEPDAAAIAVMPPAEQPPQTAEAGAGQAPVEVAREEPPAPRAHLRMVALAPKGPRPEAGVGTEGARPTLPAALRALRMVARSASSEGEVDRGMLMAGERWKTLNSEAASERVLAMLPTPAATDAPSGPPDGTSTTRPNLPEPLEDGGSAQPNSSSAPVREGASLNVGPFV